MVFTLLAVVQHPICHQNLSQTAFRNFTLSISFARLPMLSVKVPQEWQPAKQPQIKVIKRPVTLQPLVT
jgi:hypothetical protein